MAYLDDVLAIMDERQTKYLVNVLGSQGKGFVMVGTVEEVVATVRASIPDFAPTAIRLTAPDSIQCYWGEPV